MGAANGFVGVRLWFIVGDPDQYRTGEGGENSIAQHNHTSDDEDNSEQNANPERRLLARPIADAEFVVIIPSCFQALPQDRPARFLC
jgi:hypothetical protein